MLLTGIQKEYFLTHWWCELTSPTVTHPLGVVAGVTLWPPAKARGCLHLALGVTRQLLSSGNTEGCLWSSQKSFSSFTVKGKN